MLFLTFFFRLIALYFRDHNHPKSVTWRSRISLDDGQTPPPLSAVCTYLHSSRLLNRVDNNGYVLRNNAWKRYRRLRYMLNPVLFEILLIYRGDLAQCTLLRTSWFKSFPILGLRVHRIRKPSHKLDAVAASNGAP